MRLVGYGLILVVITLTVSQIVVYAPKLPDKVASHFGNDGNANDTMSKTGFLMLYGCTQGGVLLLLLGIGKLCRVLPQSMINIPHREYWLHTDRKEETIRSIEGVTIWLAMITGLFMVFVFQLTFQANLAKQQAISNVAFYSAMAFYLVGMGTSVLFLILKFARVPK